MEFLDAQLKKLEGLEKPPSATARELANFELQHGKGERLLTKHADHFDINDFCTTPEARSLVEDICGCLQHIIDVWGMGSAVGIECTVPRDDFREDEKYLNSLLNFALRDVHGDVKPELLHQWEAIKARHKDTLKYLQIIKDNALQNEKILGGDQGMVFEAVLDGTPVAVKKITRVKGDLPIVEFAELFKQALRYATLFPNPCLVRPLAVTTSGSMVVELADANLHELCHSKTRLAWRSKARLLLQGGEGLAYIHAHGLAHGDVRPQELLLYGTNPETCHLKVRPFLWFASKMERARTRKRFWTPLWMAPELYDDKPLSQKSDVYSFGVVCYAFISQTMPFGGEASTEGAIMARKLRGREPCAVDPQDCPPQMLQLMRQCCALDPAERPTMQLVCDILLNLLEDWEALDHQGQTHHQEVQYNHGIINFLDLQLQQVRKLVVPPTVKEEALVNFNLQLGRGERLIAKHSALFDVKDFYRTEDACAAVEKICECLREALEEWGLPSAARIQVSISLGTVEQDEQFLENLLSYLLKDVQCAIQDSILQHWSACKDHHAQNMKMLEIIDEGDLKIQERLGTGGHGAVYKAIWHQTRSSREVAVKKCISGEQDELPMGKYAEFLREALVHAALNDHKHIIQLLAITTSGSIVMELAETDLDKWCHVREKLPWDLKARLLQMGSSALKHIHSKNRVHGDVKPQNFLLCGMCTDDYCLKVSDFGVAFEEAQSRAMTVRIGQGTPRWMAPEAYFDQPITQMSDVFSFGVLCCEVVSQKYPYGGWRANEHSIMRKKSRGEPPCHIQVPEDCPAEAWKIIEKCCAVDPKERPTMTEVDNRFKDILEECSPVEGQGRHLGEND
ncbi:unnamed protein product [Ostreobium quekettii]|uniref:Protein kinase domain-containing protein n=1 Tax=Ostreobium quekettii TaxID=121088 RepID=A0A8S1IW24_9CHLO|nr:unnamed protein product [Ostreobium quekettii]